MICRGGLRGQMSWLCVWAVCLAVPCTAFQLSTSMLDGAMTELAVSFCDKGAGTSELTSRFCRKVTALTVLAEDLHNDTHALPYSQSPGISSFVEEEFHDFEDFEDDIGYALFAQWPLGAVAVPPFKLEDKELLEFSVKLRDLDGDRAKPGQIQLDFQEKKPAQRKMFKKVDESLFQKPTYQKYRTLVPQYQFDHTVEEKMTAAKAQAIDAFLCEVWISPTWNALVKFLEEKKHPYAKSAKDLRDAVKTIWFGEYKRSTSSKVINTSAFKHIFLGESKDKGGVNGFHYWVQFYEFEKAGRLSYLRNKQNRYDLFTNAEFTIDKKLQKPGGSFFLGTSPEYELAVYTLCFLARADRECGIQVDGCDFSITTYTQPTVGVPIPFLSTAFPKAGPDTPECKKQNQPKTLYYQEF